jgi:hypothetical protein
VWPVVGARAGHIYPHVGLLDQHRAPSATARAGTKGIAWLFLRLEFLPMSRAAPLPKKGKRLALALSFQLSTSILLFVLCAWLWVSSSQVLIHLAACVSECLGWPCMQTDKASMLDEIIDYVKFLQLQVKASMKC